MRKAQEMQRKPQANAETPPLDPAARPPPRTIKRQLYERAYTPYNDRVLRLLLPDRRLLNAAGRADGAHQRRFFVLCWCSLRPPAKATSAPIAHCFWITKRAARLQFRTSVPPTIVFVLSAGFGGEAPTAPVVVRPIEAQFAITIGRQNAPMASNKAH